MKALKVSIPGWPLVVEDRAILLLDETADPLFLRFALVTFTTEQQILPALLIDDWGHEIKTLELYAWIRDNGLRFPRAELFGFDLRGEQTQYFLRDLDLMSRYPTYFYPGVDTPISGGILLEAFCQPDRAAFEPVKVKPPTGIEPLLQYARTGWWNVHPGHFEEAAHRILST